MAGDRVGKPKCPDTGLTVPECSCRGCLERMLQEFQPALLAEEIKVSRINGGDEETGPSEHRRAA